LDPRVTAPARSRSNCTNKLQTHPLVREGTRHLETRNCQKSGHEFRMGARHQDRLSSWPSVAP
jgi:hypothetical protein